MKDLNDDELQELRKELTEVGFEELTSRDDVRSFLNRSGTAMIVINSTCGCAGPAIRDGVAEALKEEVNVDHLGTVFAGEDQEATEEVRNRAPDTEPSSPSIFLYRDGEPVKYIPRKFTMKHQYDEEPVTEELKSFYRENLEPVQG